MKALISVSDKTGIVEFAKRLEKQGVEIVSTGGTYKKLKDEGVQVMEIAELTGFPECLDGRVKTLHPIVHAGILARRDKEEHRKQLEDLKIDTIDFVVVNLYPFKQTILKEGVSLEECVENIDIGGPTMLRSAAKNYQDVTVITNPEDYEIVLKELEEKGEVSKDTKFRLMQAVFEHTANYDAMIANYIKEQRKDESLPEKLTLTYEKVQEMRYGENPHQKAALYKEIGKCEGSLTTAKQLNGKELSFNNINDTNGALELLKEFEEPTVVACKHGNPCGVGSSMDIYEAWQKAFKADKTSIFGGIVVVNEEVTVKMAEEMKEIFLEVIVAPSFEAEALALLKKKKNVRILELPSIRVKQRENAYDIKKINGGAIVQTIDAKLLDEYEVVTDTKPTPEQMEDLLFTWKIVKYVKSNGIAIGKAKQSVGIGPGQVNRIWATKQAIEHGEELIEKGITNGAVLASDAFFPFADCVEEAHKAGIKAIIQPGGSIKDQDSIDKCNEYGIAMVFTKMRHFRH